MRIDPTRTEARGRLEYCRALVADWASRGVLALLFVLGTLAMAGPPPGANRSESVIEGGSTEFESTSPTGTRIQTKRRAYFGGRAPVRAIEVRAPRVLVLALGFEAPRPCWQIPRRVVPAADDDDDDLG